jgi:hypothetical protein
MVGASATTAPVPISVLATTNGTGNTASFTVPYGKCYIVKHGTWGGDCNSVWTEERQMINNTNLPRLDNTFTVTAFPSGTGLVVEARPLTLAPVLGVHAFQLEIVNASGNLTNLGTTTFLVTPSSKLSDVVAKWNLACGVTYRVTHSVFMASSKICNRSTRTSFDIRRPCETRTERETEIVIVPSPTNAGGRSIEVTNDSKEEIVSEFNIYPNPAQDFINITYNIQSDAHLSLYNQLGQEVYTTNISKEDNAKTIDSSILENGFYLVMLKDVSGKVLEHKKLMIQK